MTYLVAYSYVSISALGSGYALWESFRVRIRVSFVNRRYAKNFHHGSSSCTSLCTILWCCTYSRMPSLSLQILLISAVPSINLLICKIYLNVQEIIGTGLFCIIKIKSKHICILHFFKLTNMIQIQLVDIVWSMVMVSKIYQTRNNRQLPGNASHWS